MTKDEFRTWCETNIFDTIDPKDNRLDVFLTRLEDKVFEIQTKMYGPGNHPNVARYNKRTAYDGIDGPVDIRDQSSINIMVAGSEVAPSFTPKIPTA